MLQVFIDLYRDWSTRQEARRARRTTINELSRLSNHDLKDIGLSRCDISRIGQEHYDNILLDMARKTQFGASPVRHPNENTNLRGWIQRGWV